MTNSQVSHILIMIIIVHPYHHITHPTLDYEMCVCVCVDWRLSNYKIILKLNLTIHASFNNRITMMFMMVLCCDVIETKRKINIK